MLADVISARDLLSRVVIDELSTGYAALFRFTNTQQVADLERV
ncbi:MAG: hypothetical protein ACJATP_003769, partial [Candidatus Azotimanducaceae bacterium]